MLEQVRHRIVVNARDGSVLVYVPEGEFEMGSAEGQGSGNEQPRHRVKLSAYWIGVHAVTNAQYLKFVQATGHRVRDNQGHREAGLKDHPVTNVSWEDSAAYAKWAGCELASEAQWEKACRGPKGLAYAWGNEWDEGKCRNVQNKGSESTSEVYGYPKGASGYGTYNQSGNVWEWCADWDGEKYYANSPKEDPGGPAGGSARVFRGGGWWFVDPVNFRAALRFFYDPGYRIGYQGFRLVRAAS